MDVWALQLLNGVSYGMLLFLLAAGLTLTFGLLRIVNLAHGSFYLLGGYVGLAIGQMTGDFLLAIAAGAVSAAVLGVVIQRVLLSRYAGKELSQVMITFGCLFLLGDLALWKFGGVPQTIPTPEVFRGAVDILGGRFPTYRFVLIAAGIVSGLFLWWFHDATKVGTMVRAAVEDAETARGLGVNVPLLMTGVFGLGALLAGAAGVIGGPLVGMYPGADLNILILAIVVVVLGGLGSLRGAFLAALVVGLLDTFGRILFPELSQFAIFAPMALMLIVRPAGLLGRS
ncbi:MAG TPA: branched-chain amino acid ABC transporter permease [Dehalococcoidia bacterium]|nr:branched-chain amino acid ABC transporter permease [Dehalococcoidia bacterium]